MASFGVMLETGSAQRSSPTKRKLSDIADNGIEDLCLPQFRNKPMNQSFRLLLVYFDYFHTKTLAFFLLSI